MDLSDGRLSRAALLVVDTQVKWTVLRKGKSRLSAVCPLLSRHRGAARWPMRSGSQHGQIQ